MATRMMGDRRRKTVEASAKERKLKVVFKTAIAAQKQRIRELEDALETEIAASNETIKGLRERISEDDGEPK